MQSVTSLNATPLRIAVAPDSFKGSVTASDVARLIAEGWNRERPGDTITLLPQADGGEGTLDALEVGEARSRRHPIGLVTGPDGRSTPGEWLEMPGSIAVVELAQVSGLPLMAAPDPLGASTFGLGEVIGAALDAGMRRLVVGAGGSASTDGGAGALAALGLGLFAEDGSRIRRGGGELARLAVIDTGTLRAPPPDGVTILADVESPLLGARGAAAVFGPQKGASADDIRLLDAALATYAALIGGDPDASGSGAAGGVAFGFAALWAAGLQSGADFIASSTGLDDAIAAADIVITGEGRFDDTSFAGKVVGRVLSRAAACGTAVIVIAGAVDVRTEVVSFSLSEIAGSMAEAMAHPNTALIEAGARAARSIVASARGA